MCDDSTKVGYMMGYFESVWPSKLPYIWFLDTKHPKSGVLIFSSAAAARLSLDDQCLKPCTGLQGGRAYFMIFPSS